MAYEKLKNAYRYLIGIRNMHRNADGAMPSTPTDFRVDRATPLGNPFPMAKEALNLEYLTKQPSQNRMAVLNKYKAWFDENSRNPEQKAYLDEMLASLKSNGNLSLWDWCAPLPCHAETIGNALGDEYLKSLNLNGSLQTVKGNLMEAPQQLIMHQANNRGAMGAGIGRLIAEDIGLEGLARYRNAVKTYPNGGLGMIIPTKSVTNPNRIYLNAIMQNGYGRDGSQYTDYNAMQTVFDKLAARFLGKDIAIPYGMGARLGGGDWDTIENLINEHLAPYANVTAYKLK